MLRSRAEIEAALRECHDDPGNGGHRGVTVTLKKLEVTYYWTTMAKDVICWVKHTIFINVIGAQIAMTV